MRPTANERPQYGLVAIGHKQICVNFGGGDYHAVRMNHRGLIVGSWARSRCKLHVPAATAQNPVRITMAGVKAIIYVTSDRDGALRHAFVWFWRMTAASRSAACIQLGQLASLHHRSSPGAVRDRQELCDLDEAI